MIISLSTFMGDLTAHPVLILIIILNLGVIVVNGATDAPNAIATCVSTRAMSLGRAILMATVFNFIGVTVMTLINASVAKTIYNMVNFTGNNSYALIAMAAAMVAIVFWGVFAWVFGIPTSESHGLIAGISGAAIALQGGLSGINGAEWIKVIYGLGLSTGLGFAAGLMTTKVISYCCRNINYFKSIRIFKNAQIVAAACMAFMHGAQDGQKFMGTMMLGIIIATGLDQSTGFDFPFWMMILCSLVMGLGTAIGGKKIIKSVGMDMVKLKTYQGFSADLAAALCLLLFSLTGLPVSTTHTKTSAIMGVGASKRISAVNWTIANEMFMTWVLTFPCCGLIGFILTKIFLKVTL